MKVGFKSIMKHLPLFMGVMFFTQVKTFGQSGWTQKKGEYYLKSFATYGASDKYYTLSGNKITTSEFTQFTFGFYGEYGLTDKLTLVLNGPVLKRQYFEGTEKITGIGDLPIGIKYGLLNGVIPVSLGLTVDVPIAKENNRADLKGSTFESINLPTGDGEWNYRLTIAASHSFHPVPVYVSAFSTFNYRTTYDDISFSNQLIAGVEGGVNLNNKVWIIGSLQTQSSLGDSEVVDFVRGEGTEFTSIQLSGIYKLTPKVGINLTAFRYTDLIVDRANLYSSGIYTLGVSYEFKK